MELVLHIIEVRDQMIEKGEISKDEPISIIGYSHGGNVAIQAAEIINEYFGVNVNVITVSTPVYQSPGDIENPEGNMGINQHIQIIHESDIVAPLVGDAKTYPKTDNTTNFVITEKEVPTKNKIDAHMFLPNKQALSNYLKKIPTMEKAPPPSLLNAGVGGKIQSGGNEPNKGLNNASDRPFTPKPQPKLD